MDSTTRPLNNSCGFSVVIKNNLLSGEGYMQVGIQGKGQCSTDNNNKNECISPIVFIRRYKTRENPKKMLTLKMYSYIRTI